HGGSDGIARRNWEIADLAEDRVVLRIVDPAGRAGYPGNCTITATYHLKPGGVLSVVYESTTDAPTIANICQHSYFSLADGHDTSDHELTIAAEHYLPADELQVPVGRPQAVQGTPVDFRTMQPMLRLEDGARVLYDHNLCPSPQRVGKRLVAHARSPKSGVNLHV